MKKILYLIILSFVSCTFLNEAPHKKAIKDYLEEHLDDPKSYQPIEFKIVNPRFVSIPKIEEQLKVINNILVRQEKLIGEFLLGLGEQINKDSIPTISDVASRFISNEFKISQNNVNSIKEYHNELKLEYEILEKLIKSQNLNPTQEDIDILAQLEGTANRVIIEIRELEKWLYAYGMISPNQKSAQIILVIHRYRASNIYGGIVLNRKIFEYDRDENFVVGEFEDE